MRSVTKSERDVHPAQVYRRLFVPSATDALTRVHGGVDAVVRYVISSTWRKSFSGEQLKVVLRHAGIGFVADRLQEGEKWRTPPKFGRSRRIVGQWLDRHHSGEPFVILDDTQSGASLMPTVEPLMLPSNVTAPPHPSEAAPHSFAEQVVQCDQNVGLNSDHAPLILAAPRCAVPVARIAA